MDWVPVPIELAKAAEPILYEDTQNDRILQVLGIQTADDLLNLFTFLFKKEGRQIAIDRRTVYQRLKPMGIVLLQGPQCHP